MGADAQAIERVRQFNRFYTRQIGALREGLLDTPFSLTQARVLYELGSRAGRTAGEIAADLGLNAGYLSRLLKSFEKQGLLVKSAASGDKRVRVLKLTAKGKAEFRKLDARSRTETAEMLEKLPDADRTQLTAAMSAIEHILNPAPASDAPAFIIRAHRPGDIGWVISRHGEIYANEYNWDISFEGFVAQIAGKFLLEFDPECEHCWIAERNGQRLGSVFLVKQSKTVAKLRMLLVDEAARGLGVGSALVKECLAFARSKGYRKVTLWTNDILHAARRIYQREGFVLVKEEKHHSFGQDLVGQNWDLKL